MRRKIVTLVALAATAGLLAGCGSGAASASIAAAGPPSQAATATPVPAQTTAPTPTPTPTPQPTPGPSPRALCSNGDGVFPIKKCPLVAGTYTAAPFAPIFRFTIGAGWTNTLAGINAGQLQRDKPVTTFFGWSTGMVAEDGSQIGKTTDSMLAYFAAVPGIVASTPTTVTIGGMPGRSIDFTLTKGSIFMRVGKSGGGFNPGEKVRAIIVDVYGTVVMLAGEVADPKDFDAEMIRIQEILDTIVWS